MKTLLSSIIRKIIFGACSAWITAVVTWLNSSGVFTEGELNTEKIMAGLVQVFLAVVLMAGSAIWSYIKRKLEERKTIIQ